MSNKTKKALKIIAFLLIFVILATVTVFYCVYPTQTKEFVNNAWNWLNQPIPVLGVSAVVVAFFLWRIFMSTSYGRKKYNDLKAEYKQLKVEYDEFKDNANKCIEELKDKASQIKNYAKDIKGYVDNIRDAIPNKKIKKIEFKEREYGKETKEEIDHETRAD